MVRCMLLRLVNEELSIRTRILCYTRTQTLLDLEDIEATVLSDRRNRTTDALVEHLEEVGCNTKWIGREAMGYNLLLLMGIVRMGMFLCSMLLRPIHRSLRRIPGGMCGQSALRGSSQYAISPHTT
jgi:hypothetical protein